MSAFEKVEYEFPDQQAEAAEEAEAQRELEVQVIDDTPEVDRNREPLETPPKDVTDDELEKYDASVKSRIKHFSRGYHDERRAKEAAQREHAEALRLAKALVEENKKLRGSLSEGQDALVGQAKRVVASDLEAAKRKYRAAHELGDSDALAEAQQELTAVTIRADKLENFKPAPLQPSIYEVQTEQHVAAPRVDEQLISWQDKNKWFGENKRMTAYALGLHEDLVKEGVAAGSDQYYKKLDADLRQRFPEQFDAEDVDAKTQPKARSNVVAPATRSTAARKVVLTQSQVNTARRLGVSLELYARNVAELERK